MTFQQTQETEPMTSPWEATTPLPLPRVTRTTASPFRRPKWPHRLVLALVLAFVAWFMVPGTWAPPLPAWVVTPIRDVTGEAARIASAYASEEPRLLRVSPNTPLPLCADATEDQARRLAPGFRMMRGTPEGERLFRGLLDNDVCVRVEALPYNSGYTRAVRSGNGSWADSEIVVDDAIARAGEPDVLAALLVHEATHLDRAVSGTACWEDDSCTELANGVRLEEEIAAHQAEAAWWLAAYGADGKRFAVRADHGMNELVRAYLAGWDPFVDYVTTLRDDTREGTGIDGRKGMRDEQ